MASPLKFSVLFAAILGAGVLVAAGFPARNAAHAAEASLYLSPSSGTFTAGNTFTVSIYVDTGGESVNAVEADLGFDPSKLQVVSPSSGKSFFQTWVVQPTYSNTAGTLNFSGAIPNPGIATSAGLISTITFRVMDTGTTAIKFMDSSKVLLNDGLGTDILSQTSDGIYTLAFPPPAGPIVTSPTNPDPGKWYDVSQVVLQWAAEPGVTGYSYMVSDNPVETPNNVISGTSTSADYMNLADGVHYFHIKALKDGVWGGVTDFPIRVEQASPAAFTVDISPGTYTTDQNPVIRFATTDPVSGIDHYEVKVISLDPGAPQSAGATPFFVEASSPYLQHFPLGRYTIAVRAYNKAGSYTQETANLSVVTPFLESVGGNGVQIGGAFVLEWPYVFGLATLLLILLGFGLARVLKHHHDIEVRLARGAAANPEVAAKLADLQAKRKEYEDALKRLSVILLLAGSLFAMLGAARGARAADGGLTLNPPIINLYPSSIGNDEVLYLGGWANVPNATVEIYIQQSETGNTYSGTVTTGKDGNWFFSFPQLLDSGHYAAWAELVEGQSTSPPSARVSITVSPTAIQLGSARLDYVAFYLLLFLLALAAAIVLLILIVVYGRRVRAKRFRLEAAIRAAEESLRRGFTLLQRDIEAELAGVQQLKLAGPLPAEEHEREEKLRRDLDAVKHYIGKEIWHIEEEEEK